MSRILEIDIEQWTNACFVLRLYENAVFCKFGKTWSCEILLRDVDIKVHWARINKASALVDAIRLADASLENEKKKEDVDISGVIQKDDNN